VDRIRIGDLVIITFPYLKWSWQTYQTGDVGLVLKVTSGFGNPLARVKLFRNEETETIPLEYLSRLGEEDEGWRPSGSK